MFSMQAYLSVCVLNSWLYFIVSGSHRNVNAIVDVVARRIAK